MVKSPLDDEAINNFIDLLKINEEQKETLKKRVPLLGNEEKVFLWKSLIDIYKLDEEEKKAVENIEKNF